MNKGIPYLISVLMMLVLTVFVTPIRSFLGPINISMLYILPVLISASFWGRGPAVFTAAIGVVTFDFFFVSPFLTFTVDDFRYLLSFVILLTVGFVTGTLSARLKNQISHSWHREKQVSALYSLSKDLTAVNDFERVLNSITNKVAETLDCRVVIFLPDATGNLELSKCSSNEYVITNSELAVAKGIFAKGYKGDIGIENLGSSIALFLPLNTEQGTQGILGVTFNEIDFKDESKSERMDLLEAFAGLAAMAINRIKLADDARMAHTLAESERLRTALFNSLSHDLRTPLASIIGAASGLLEDQEAVYSPDTQRDLLQTIVNGAERMNRFVTNLLDMARLESGMLKLNRDWCDIQDIIGVAVNRLGVALATHPVQIDIPEYLPLVQVDYVLIEQVLINLLDNAVKYSEQGSQIIVSVTQRQKHLEIAVANRGNHIPETDLSKVFDKFYRLNSPLQVSGTGLGLSICKGIVEAHNGSVWAENNQVGGVTIRFSLPMDNEYLSQVPSFTKGDQ